MKNTFIKAIELLEMRNALYQAKVQYNEIKKLDRIINLLPETEVLDAQQWLENL